MATRVRLEEITEIITKGTTPTTLGYDFMADGVPFLRAQNLQNGKIDTATDALFISEATHKALSRSQIFPGDVLVSIAGTIGRASVVEATAPAMNCNQAVAIIRPNGGELDQRYLLRWLECTDAQDQIRKSQVTATISNLSLGQIANLTVPLPSLDEQRRIAAILDQAATLHSKRLTAIRHLGSFEHAAFIEMFGELKFDPSRWPTVDFERACSDETSRSDKLHKAEYSSRGILPVVDQGQSEIAGWTSDRSLMCRSDLPVIVFGDHTRAVKFVDKPFVIGADGAKVLKPTSKFAPRFFAQLLRELPIPNLGYSRHMREVKRLHFFCPPLDLQNRFASRAEQAERVLKKMRTDLGKLHGLFATLQQTLFGAD